MRALFIFILLILLLLQQAPARPVNKAFATVLSNHKELALEGDSSFSLQKEVVPNVAKISGRKMSSTVEKSKVSMAALSEGSGRRKGDEERNWKDSFMAFSADYRTPKPHPPKNN